MKENDVRRLVREALDGVGLGATVVGDSDEPVNVNDVVDPSESTVDPMNPNFVPRSKVELDNAIGRLTSDVPAGEIPNLYRVVSDAVTSFTKGDEMAKSARAGAKSVEESIRRAIRKVLKEAELPPVRKIPFGVHGDEYMRRYNKTRSGLAKTFKSGGADDRPEENEFEPTIEQEPTAEPGKKRRAYKTTALGSMVDVSGMSFSDIAKELGFSVAGAKQAVDKALQKARWLSTELDEDDLEILVLQSMNEYIDMLNQSGELTPADVALMKDHPDVVRELDGFREYLDKIIRRMRSASAKGGDPLGEHNRRVAEALRIAESIRP